MDEPPVPPRTVTIVPGERLETAWQAWRAGRPVPRWDAHLTQPCEPDQQFLLIQIDIEQRIKAGLAALLAEKYFQHPQVHLERTQQAELIRWEYQLRWKNGGRAAVGDYVAAFAEHAEALRRLRPRWDCPGCRRAATLEDESAQSVTCASCAITYPLAEIFRPRRLPPTDTEDLSKFPSLPDYEILSQLGQGGMGVVYKARQRSLKRIVALKMIRGQVDERTRKRFQTEAEAAAGLQHPNIVQVYEVGDCAGQPYFSQEFVGGGSLDRFLAGAPQPASLAARMVECLARAMAFAHRHGILHRDLKPANILLAPLADENETTELHREGQASEGLPWAPKIADFGLAKRLEADASQTHSGAVIGTPSYMAPEQARGTRTGSADVGPAVDVYALGAIIYEVVTGRAPFRAATAWDTIQQVLNEEPVPPRRLQSTVPRDLDTICLKCLEKDPARRYASAEALADDLKRFLAGEPVRARPARMADRLVKWVRRRKAVAGLLVLGVVAVLLAIGGVVNLAYSGRLRAARDRAREAETDAIEQRGIAEKERARAEDQRALAVRLKYLAQMNLARRAWDSGDVPRMLDLLDSYRDPAPGSDDPRQLEWYYLRRLSRVQLRLSVEGDIHAVAFSPDGARLACAWTLQMGFREELQPQRRVVPNIVGSGVRVWDARTGRMLLDLKGQGRVASVAFAHDGKRLAMADGQAIAVRDASDGRPLFSLKDQAAADRVLFSRDGERLVGVWSNRLKLCDARTGREIRVIETRVGGIAFSADGKRLAFAGPGVAQVRILDATTGGDQATLAEKTPEPTDRIIDLDFNPDGTRLATLWAKGKAKVWDAATGEEVFAPWPANAQCLVFTPDGRRLISAGRDHTIRLWDVVGGKQVKQVLAARGHGPPPHREALGSDRDPGIMCLALSADGVRLATAAADRVVWTWEIREAPATALAGFSPLVVGTFTAGKNEFVGLGKDLNLRVWDLDTGRLMRQTAWAIPDPRNAGVFIALSSWAFSADGARLASTQRGGKSVQIWDTTTGKQVAQLDGPGGGAPLIFSPDGRWLAMGGGTIFLWELKSGAAPARLTGHSQTAFTLAFSPDGERLASGGEDTTVKVWDVPRARLLHSLGGHTWSIYDLAFSPDGNSLASASKDSTVRIWNPTTGELVHIFRGHPKDVYAVEFSPDGERLMTSGEGPELRFWDMLTGQEVMSIPTTPCRFSASGRLLRSLDGQGNVRILDARPLP